MDELKFLEYEGLKHYNELLNERNRTRMKYKGELELLTTRTDWNDLIPCAVGDLYVLTGTDGDSIEIGGVEYAVGDTVYVTKRVQAAGEDVTVNKISASGGKGIIKVDTLSGVVGKDGFTYFLTEHYSDTTASKEYNVGFYMYDKATTSFVPFFVIDEDSVVLNDKDQVAEAENTMRFAGDVALNKDTRTNWNDLAPCRERMVYQITGTAGDSVQFGMVKYTVGDMIVTTNKVTVDDAGVLSGDVTVKKIGGQVLIDNKTIVKNEDGELETKLGGYYITEEEATKDAQFDLSGDMIQVRYEDAATGDVSWGYAGNMIGDLSQAHVDALIGTTFKSDIEIVVDGITWRGLCQKDSNETMLLIPPITMPNGSQITRYYKWNGQNRTGLLYAPQTSSTKTIKFSELKMSRVLSVTPAEVSYADNDLIAIDEQTMARDEKKLDKNLIAKSFIDVDDLADVDPATDDFRAASLYHQTTETTDHGAGLYYYADSQWNPVGAGVEILRLD